MLLCSTISDRSSLSAFSGLKDAESDHVITDHPEPQTVGSSANQQPPKEGATNPNYVLISKPGSLLKTQHQQNSLSSSAPLHLVAFPMPYSGSLDMFCHIDPDQMSNINHPLTPVLTPSSYTDLNPSQIAESQEQRPNDASVDAAFLPANNSGFPGPSPERIHSPASCLPAFSALPAQGLQLLYGSDSLLVQNKAQEASSDPVPVQRPAADRTDCTVTEPPSFQPITAERYI